MTRTVIAEWRRNAREEIVVALDEYQEHPVVDIRCWYQDDASGAKKPGRQGITLSIARHLEPLARALAEAVEVARERGLLIEGGKRGG
jgi:hypothetical protein